MNWYMVFIIVKSGIWQPVKFQLVFVFELDQKKWNDIL